MILRGWGSQSVPVDVNMFVTVISQTTAYDEHATLVSVIIIQDNVENKL